MAYSRGIISQSFRLASLGSWSVASILALLVLSACSSAPRELSIRTAPTQIDRPTERPKLPNPAPISQGKVTWHVLTPTTLPKTDKWVFMGVTPKDYETLSKNNADVLRFVREAMWRLSYYRGELPPVATPPDLLQKWED